MNDDKLYLLYELSADAFAPPGAEVDADLVQALLAVFDGLLRAQPQRLLYDAERKL